MNRPQFLHKLEEEAGLQAQLRAQQVLPKRLKPLTDLVGRHTWKALLIASGLLSLLTEWGSI